MARLRRLISVILSISFALFTNPAFAEAPEEPFYNVPWAAFTVKERLPDTFTSCVKYARQFLPIPLIHTPGDLEPNSDVTIGGAILLVYGDVHHIAIVSSFSIDEVCFHESNYRRGELSSRCVPLDAKEIRGYWYPN